MRAGAACLELTVATLVCAKGPATRRLDIECRVITRVDVLTRNGIPLTNYYLLVRWRRRDKTHQTARHVCSAAVLLAGTQVFFL